jgi:hypothetical protein
MLGSVLGDMGDIDELRLLVPRVNEDRPTAIN